jgi:streptogramin lyase
LARDASGHIFVLDRRNDRIQHSDADRNFINMWGSRGLEDGQFLYTRGISVDNQGHVYAVDGDLNRCYRFDYQGNVLSSWTGPAGELPWLEVRGILAAPEGKMWIADYGANRIYLYEWSTSPVRQQDWSGVKALYR